MRTTRLGTMLVAAAVLGAACGGGHALFDIDVFSFMQGTGGDTLHYTVPTGLGGTINNPPLSVTLLPGLSGSVVDTVQVTGAATIQNQTGAGTVSFKIFFSEDSNTVYAIGNTPILTASGNAGPGMVDSALVLNAVLTSAQDSLFTKKKLFVGVQAGLNNTSAQTLDGRLQLTALHLRLVVNDKLF